ncbi:class F sortase [Streptomyces sp. NPDC088785]|uniref:class F sortase n=1 Tax=Streptomyces sp. NPDC088785 TaxID=3365897 RepID=UPI0038126EDD
MDSRDAPRGSWWRGGRQRLLSATAAAVLIAAGIVVLTVALLRQTPPPPGAASARSPGTATSPSAPPATGHDGKHRPEAAPRTMPASPPTRLSIPVIGVKTSLERLGLDGKGAMRTPEDPARAGWFTPGPAPGAKGPAVLAGHVTWNRARSVFFDLGSLRAGDHVYVDREDGTTARFTVTRTAQYAKDRFPSVEVYRNTDYAALRLITCAGTYRDHSYADNIVVYARLDTAGT